jgi:Ankyrin repeats (3 copies)/Ankyrin repeats (many copies)/Ankyrin repeat
MSRLLGMLTSSISMLDEAKPTSHLSVHLQEMDKKMTHFFQIFQNQTRERNGNLQTAHRRIMSHHHDCAISLKKIVLAARSRLEAVNVDNSDVSSIVGGLNRQQELLTERWVNAHVGPCLFDPNERTVSTVASLTEIDSNSNDGDSEVRFQVIQNQRQSATRYVKAGQFSKAEPFLRKVMTKSEEFYGPQYDWREEMMEMLSRACYGQSKLEEAERLLLQILEERLRSGRNKEAFETMHALAEVYFEYYHRSALDDLDSAEGQWETAKSYADKAITGKMKILGPNAPSFHQSVGLLVQLYKAKGDKVMAAGYLPMLPDDYWNKQRQAIDQLKSMRPAEAASTVGSEIFVDLLPTEYHWRWEEIKENMRRRRNGVSGSGCGYTLLHAVAEYGDEAALRRLIEDEPQINAKDNDGNAALHLAAKGRESIVRLLIENGADIDVRANDGKTPLMIAAENELPKIVLLLVDNRARVNVRDDLNWTALHYASFNGNVDVARVLLQSGADVDSKGAADKTPLHCAASRGHQNFVRLLLQNRANVKAKCKDSQSRLKSPTALDLARKYRHENVVQLLQNALSRRIVRN